MPDPTPTIRRTITFAGRVQGVGFRATTVRIAESHDIAGTVRNLPDGRVECVVEGSRSALDGFIADLLRVMNRYVREHHVHETPATGEFGEPGAGVRIRY